MAHMGGPPPWGQYSPSRIGGTPFRFTPPAALAHCPSVQENLRKSRGNSDAQLRPSPRAESVTDRLAKPAEPQVAPVNLEDLSPIEFLKDRTKGIGVLRATDAVA